MRLWSLLALIVSGCEITDVAGRIDDDGRVTPRPDDPAASAADTEPPSQARRVTRRKHHGLLLGLYGGIPLDRDVDVDIDAGGFEFSDDVETEGQYVIGFRTGYLAPAGPTGGRGVRLDVGAVLDTALTQQTTPDFIEDKLTTVSVSPQFILGLRFGSVADSARDRGIVEPYLAFGPALFYVDSEAADDSVVAFGLDGRVGLAIPLTDEVSIFGEGRAYYCEPEFEDDFGDELTAELLVFSVMGGLMLRF